MTDCILACLQFWQHLSEHVRTGAKRLTFRTCASYFVSPLEQRLIREIRCQVERILDLIVEYFGTLNWSFPAMMQIYPIRSWNPIWVYTALVYCKIMNIFGQACSDLQPFLLVYLHTEIVIREAHNDATFHCKRAMLLLDKPSICEEWSIIYSNIILFLLF